MLKVQQPAGRVSGKQKITDMKCNVVEWTNLISIYNGLNYSTREVNRNFKIKVSGIVGDTKYHCLVGVYGLLNMSVVRWLISYYLVPSGVKRTNKYVN